MSSICGPLCSLRDDLGEVRRGRRRRARGGVAWIETSRAAHARVRDDRVEHEPARVVRVRQRVALGDVRPVGGAVERDLVHVRAPRAAPRGPRRCRCAVEAPLGRRSCPRSWSPRPAVGGVRSDAPICLLQRRAIERVAAGPALCRSRRAGRARPRRRATGGRAGSAPWTARPGRRSGTPGPACRRRPPFDDLSASVPLALPLWSSGTRSVAQSPGRRARLAPVSCGVVAASRSAWRPAWRGAARPLGGPPHPASTASQQRGAPSHAT